MDSQRFDDLIKAFAVRRSRRGVLRTALGGMGAGLLGLVGGTGASARHADFDPLVGTPTLCGEGLFLTVCGSDEYCCNESCGICAPIGGACTEQFCGGDDFDPLVGTPTLCGEGLFLTVCGSDEYCCNESCGICAPIGGACTEQFCGGDD